ncbi:HD domain-containing phosphohydrolase [Mycolicibacterium septicum]|uniref:HD domain-containing phosphohydrolase n=1 Tax=Mycolicibacterium septicum TaxID=98668 RepID=UPI0023E334A0|nr:HD domain-containing phosphohydrolase [Mycolicibacterium septicum]MDF3336318.1 HD domain-containing phosphohydrolase [Mycolicibacterium septicum]
MHTGKDGGGRDSGISLAELLAAFSFAMDLGLGQPIEHVLRSWRLAARLGERVGLVAEQRADLYYTAVLAWVGCIADAPEVSAWFGDDIAFRADSYRVDLRGLGGATFMLSHAGSAGPLLNRVRKTATLIATGGRDIEQGLMSHCLNTSTMAERLGLDAAVGDALRQFFARWDGNGVPAGLGGEAIALPMRLFHLADVAEVVHRDAGVDAAVHVATSRRGTQFDPAVVDAFCAAAGDLLSEDDDESDCHALIAAEPALQRRLTEDQLDSALEVFADFTDLRSPHRAGHSRGVAELAERAAKIAGLTEGDAVLVRRAALLHDIGLHGVPAIIMDKPGKLSASDHERLRLSSYYTERVLARPGPVARIGAVAALAYERMDSSGAHRGLSGRSIPVTGRILAAADCHRAMTEPRPYRPALSAKAAGAELRAEVRSGRLDAAAVDAVLEAAGGPGHRRRVGPDGLTPREIEVLGLIARGASTRQVASTLGISPKTAGTHIERIYTKTGSSTRSTATLYAITHGLLDTLSEAEK